MYLSTLYKTSSLLLLSLTVSAQNIMTNVYGTHNDIHIDQIGNGNFLLVNIQGNLNDIKTTQANTSAIPNMLDVVVNGEYNEVDVVQENGANLAKINIEGSGNDADVIQRGSGMHQLDLEIVGDDNVASILQENEGNHSAMIKLENGGGPWNLELVQSGIANTNINEQDLPDINGICYSSMGCNITLYKND